MKSKEDIKHFYEKFTQNLIQDRIYSNPRHQKIISYLKKVFRRYNFRSALEIGCGIGILSEFISKNVPEVNGIDISEENIKFAKATVNNVNFYCTDFLEFNLKDKYDLITLFDVLEHFPKETHPEVFKKITEISNPSTIILITIPDPDYLSHIREHFPEKLQVVDESIYLDELLKIFNENNHQVLKFEKYGIDYNDQYNFYLLNYRKKQYKLDPVLLADSNFFVISFGKLVNKSKRVVNRIRYNRYLK